MHRRRPEVAGRRLVRGQIRQFTRNAPRRVAADRPCAAIEAAREVKTLDRALRRVRGCRRSVHCRPTETTSACATAAWSSDRHSARPVSAHGPRLAVRAEPCVRSPVSPTGCRVRPRSRPRGIGGTPDRLGGRRGARNEPAPAPGCCERRSSAARSGSPRQPPQPARVGKDQAKRGDRQGDDEKARRELTSRVKQALGRIGSRGQLPQHRHGRHREEHPKPNRMGGEARNHFHQT